MRAVLDLILMILDLYKYVIIGVAILSWLVAFNVINLHNDIVRSLWTALNALTEPVLQPIRRMLPAMGTMDISPIIVLLGIFFVQDVIIKYIYPGVF